MGDNIHRISDFENHDPNNRQRVPLLGGNITSGTNPRKESFFVFLKNFCCPMSTVKSVMFVVSMIDIIMYIITLSQGIAKSTPERPLLLPPKEETLKAFGDLVS